MHPDEDQFWRHRPRPGPHHPHRPHTPDTALCCLIVWLLIALVAVLSFEFWLW